jgi:hypothetical protein
MRRRHPSKNALLGVVRYRRRISGGSDCIWRWDLAASAPRCLRRQRMLHARSARIIEDALAQAQTPWYVKMTTGVTSLLIIMIQHTITRTSFSRYFPGSSRVGCTFKLALRDLKFCLSQYVDIQELFIWLDKPPRLSTGFSSCFDTA